MLPIAIPASARGQHRKVEAHLCAKDLVLVLAPKGVFESSHSLRGFALFGISFQTALTFGGSLGTFLSLAAWWLLAFAGACIYTVWTFPWEDQKP